MRHYFKSATKRADIRRYNLKRLYNLTPEEWTAQFDKQGQKCACCHRQAYPPHRLAVDLHPQTHQFKGLVCFKCRVMLNILRRFDYIAVAVRTYLSDEEGYNL